VTLAALALGLLLAWYALERSRRKTHAMPGGHPLIPQTPERRARMDEWVERTSLIGDDPISESHKSAGNAVPGLTLPLFAAMIVDIPYRKIFEGLLFHRLKVRPLLFFVMKLRGISGLAGGPPAKVIARSARDIATHLDALEDELSRSGGPWILGNEFTLADIGWVPIFERLAEADSLDCFVGGELRPRCTAYWEALKCRPSYKSAVLAYGHETVLRGTERLRAAKAANPSLNAALETVEAPQITA
jgi:glutathione S-transferase